MAKIKYHRWVTLVAVDIDVICNEDGRFSARLPTEFQIVDMNDSSTIQGEVIFCANCQENLEDVFGKVCASER